MPKAAPVRVGVAGWDYPDWKGVLYPAPKPRGFDPVRYLANYIDLIEVNSTFYRPVAPHVAERWEEPDDTTVVFHLRRGVRWHNKPPLNGREFVADDVKFTFDRFLTETRRHPAVRWQAAGELFVADTSR